MIKKLWNLLTFTVVTMVGVTLVSCGGDSDDDESLSVNRPIENPEDNLPETSRNFVGYWVGNGPSFVFFADGTSQLFEGGRFMDKGYWTFNEVTNILATTVGEWQWQITLSNSEAWAGISLGSAKAMTYHRDDKRFALACLRNTTWECDTLTMSFDYNTDTSNSYSIGFNSDDYKSLMELYPEPASYHQSISYRKRVLRITESSISISTIVAEYEITDSYQYTWWGDKETRTHNIDKGTLTIKNYNRSNASITLSKNTDHEYKLKI